MTPPSINLMIDSGAFSAFTQKKEIKLDQYCDFLIRIKPHIKKAVVLDVINPNDPEVAAQAGWNNFVYMRDKGIDTMPVFHARENVSWLDKMIQSSNSIGADAVGLSGTSLVSPEEHMQWYHLIFQYATDTEGRPIANFHAFGDTNIISAKTFPWATMDSATWQITSGRTACVIINGKYYQFRSKKVRKEGYLSIDDPSVKRDLWEGIIKSRKLNIEKVMANQNLKPVELTCLRCFLNAQYMMEIQQASSICPRYKGYNPLISTKKYGPGQDRLGTTQIYFVVSTAVCPWALPVLAKLGIHNILISYYYIEPKFFDKTFIPYLYDPVKVCKEDEKLKKYWDLLEEYTLP